MDLRNGKRKAATFRDFSIATGSWGMKKPGRSLKIKEKSFWLGRALSCVVLESTHRPPPWASPIPRCSRRRSSSRAVATTSIGPVRSAVSPVRGTGSSPAPCMTWATRWPGGPAISASPTPSTTALGACHRFFTADMSDLAAPKARYTHRVVALAVRSVVEDGLPYQVASWHLWRDHRVFVPFATIPNWVEARGKKGGRSHRGRLPRSGPRRLLRVHRRGRVVRRPLLRPVDRR